MTELITENPDISVLELTPEPTKLSAWLQELWMHRQVIGILARKDFQVRYKRASLGILWAVLLPVIQAVIFIVVFRKVGRFSNTTFNYSAFVLAGTLAWGYFNTTITSTSTAIVDGASFTDKVWFPRVVLVLAPALGNLVSLALSMCILLASIPLVNAQFTWRVTILVPALLLLITFTLAFGFVASALHVYFRDVKFIVMAGLMVWLYVTPIIYPASALHSFGPWLDFNPMTGIIGLFQFAVAGSFGPMFRSTLVSIAATLILLAIGIEANRRHDRLFVDQL